MLYFYTYSLPALSAPHGRPHLLSDLITCHSPSCLLPSSCSNFELGHLFQPWRLRTSCCSCLEGSCTGSLYSWIHFGNLLTHPLLPRSPSWRLYLKSHFCPSEHLSQTAIMHSYICFASLWPVSYNGKQAACHGWSSPSAYFCIPTDKKSACSWEIQV